MSRLADLLRPLAAVISVGASHFADSLRAQGLEVVEVDWRPPVADAVVRRALDRLL